MPLCSQNAHDETVLVRCAHDGAPHPQTLADSGSLTREMNEEDALIPDR